jgi:hypothetical protein
VAWNYSEPRVRRRPLDTPVRPAGGSGGGGPPTGPAGGDLAGTYPNPTIGPGAVGNAEISDVAYAKVTGAPAIPTTLPPSGPASGDLTGTYPAPTIGAAKVTRAKTAPDCWLPPVPGDPADVAKVLTVLAGPTLAWQPPAVETGVTGVWNYRTVDGTGDPGVRNLSPDVAAAPTFLRFSKTETDGTDASNVLVTTGVGDVLLAQQRTDASKWSKLQVRAPIVDHGTWVEAPITVLATSGAGAPTNNQDVVVQFQRGTGSTSSPPSGPAGGDLTGTYPNPTIAAGAVGNAEISDVAYSKVTGAPTIPTTLPPTGPAGGDLTGTYPNPTIGPGAVGNAEISDVAWSKIVGAPAGASSWTEDGPNDLLYPTTLSREVAIGHAAALPSGTGYAGTKLYIKDTTAVVNGATMALIEHTAPTTNQTVGYGMYTPDAKPYVYVDFTNKFFGVGSTGVATKTVNAAPVLLLGLATGSFATSTPPHGWVELLQYDTFAGRARVPTVLTRRTDKVAAGASVTGLFDVLALTCGIVTLAGTGVGRSHRYRASGTITRAAGIVGLQVKFGNTGSENLLLDWSSGAVTWAAAAWALDVDYAWTNVGGQYAVRLWVTADPPAAPTPAVTIAYLTRGSFATLTTGQANAKLILRGSFDTAHASNEVAQYLGTWELL